MDDYFTQIADALLEGESDLTVDLVRQALQVGLDPTEIISRGLTKGMDIVGQKFSEGEYFLPHLIISAKVMQEALRVLEPELHARHQEIASAGKIVLGTVYGDIHEIGKSLVGTMLSAHGFQVYDLGVDVPPDRFVAKVRETGASFVGISALLTTTMSGQRDVIEALQEAGLRQSVKVMVGGAPVSENWANEIGADGYAEDAAGAVHLALQLANSQE
jgi:corrinoid protein of di/trimethylamine methyltransferase